MKTTTPGRPSAVVLLGAMLGGRYPELIPAAHQLGLTVLAVDDDTPRARNFDRARRQDPEHPLAGIAQISWFGGADHESVVQRLLDWDREYKIKALIAYGEDYVEVASVAADLLGLPSPGLRAGRVCRNKLLQRRYLADWSPASTLVRPQDRAEIGETWHRYPAVVKPLDGQASDGVERVGDRSALAAALAQRPAEQSLLIEEQVSGPEISVESLVQHGRVVFAGITGKRTNEGSGEYFVELAHTVPDPRLDETQRTAVFETNEAVLRRLAFRDGIAHAEYRIAEDGTVRLMEIAARPAGDNILTLHRLATGAALEEALLRIALGEPAEYPQPRRYARQVYAEHRPGVLRDVSAPGVGAPVDWLQDCWKWPDVKPLTGEPAAVRMIVSGLRRGDELRPIRSSGDRAVMYVVDAPDVAELDAACDLVDATLVIEVDPHDG